MASIACNVAVELCPRTARNCARHTATSCFSSDETGVQRSTMRSMIGDDVAAEAVEAVGLGAAEALPAGRSMRADTASPAPSIGPDPIRAFEANFIGSPHKVTFG